MKVQSFKNISGYINKSEDFLLKNEVSNNLFWEVLEELKKAPTSSHWAANVMQDGNIKLSVIRTSSNYLMLSKGDKLASGHLLKYLKKKKTDFLGVTGEFANILSFAQRLNAPFRKVSEPEGAYQMEHSANVMLINPRGDYHGFFRAPLDIPKMRVTLRSAQYLWDH